MLFKEKGKEVKVLQYEEDRKTVERRIKFKKAIAEETNSIIAVFNKESEGFKLNNSILVNIALNCLVKQLAKVPEEEAVEILKNKVLEEALK